MACILACMHRCGGWYVGTGSLFYLNTSHYGFGDVVLPSTASNDVGYEGRAPLTSARWVP